MSDYFLADDLSGALDAAAAFHGAGRRVRVVLSAAEWTPRDTDEVVGVTTETRNASAAVAAATVAHAIARGRAHGARLLYKKIDSTLRGPVAAELRAIVAGMPEARILFAPANPAVGRTVRGGRMLVHGVPVAETEFARDPTGPVQQSELRSLVGEFDVGRVVIPDTESDEAIAASVALMEKGGPNWVPIGSGALARVVALRSASAATPRSDLSRAVAAGPILMVCGSSHRVNRAQAEDLWKERGVAVRELRSNDVAGTVRAAGDALRSSGAASVLIGTARIDSGAALRAITDVTAALIAGANVRRLFITGGETAFAICCALAVSDLEFLAEIEPGVGLAHAAGGDGGWLLAVKPGGFGDGRTWINVWDRLRAT